MKSIINNCASLRLTVVMLLLLMSLIFVGTIDQVNLGIYEAQKKYFQSFFVIYQMPGGWRLPVFPGGFSISLVLTVNLISALIVRFPIKRRYIGLLISHLGVLILLVGGGLFYLFATESQLAVEEGQTKNYSEDLRKVEMVIIDKSDPQHDTVVSVPGELFKKNKLISHEALPFDIKIQAYLPNAHLFTKGERDFLSSLPEADRGIGSQINVEPKTEVLRDDMQNNVTIFVELFFKEKSLGTWLLSQVLGAPQGVTVDNKDYELYVRQKRYYTDYAITLKDFKHDLYPGTDIPKNYSSLVYLEDLNKGEGREVLIYMNHPLRYRGKTYFQASFGKDDKLSVFQVVENAGWLLPYIASTMIALGLLIHFLLKLTQFSRSEQL